MRNGKTIKMNDEKRIEVLNSLITINNDRIEGYETALEETEEHDLKILFAEFISTSKKCKQELMMDVKIMGGEIAEGTKASGKFFRAWMDVKAALTGKDRKAILNSCQYGENKALEVYNDVLENELEHLSAEQGNMIFTQQSLLMDNHNRIKALRTALVEA